MSFRKEPIAPGITAYYDVMPDPQSFINNINSLVENKKLSWKQGRVGSSEGGESVVDTELRFVDLIGLPPFDRMPTISGAECELLTHLSLNGSILPIIQDYSEVHQLPALTGENWQILKYGAGHHFKNHIDNSKVFPRTCSISYYLNDDYGGGEIEFPRFGLKVKPVANQAIVFPANYVYNHAVHPVTSGTRWAVVNWFN